MSGIAAQRTPARLSTPARALATCLEYMALPPPAMDPAAGSDPAPDDADAGAAPFARAATGHTPSRQHVPVARHLPAPQGRLGERRGPGRWAAPVAACSRASGSRQHGVGVRVLLEHEAPVPPALGTVLRAVAVLTDGADHGVGSTCVI